MTLAPSFSSSKPRRCPSWRQAEDGGEYVVAVLKALVWPGLLVYHALKALNSVTARGQSEIERGQEAGR